jgi:hypothetical protein
MWVRFLHAGPKDNMTYAIKPTMTLAQWNQSVEQNTYEIHKPNPDAAISMMAGGADEMIRVTKDGFWVRGVKVAQDDKEAEHVYNAFKQWLVWAQLTGQV